MVSGQLTPEEWDRLEQVRKYVATATPGPWTWEDWTVTGMLPSEGPNKNTLTSPHEHHPYGCSANVHWLRNPIVMTEDGYEPREADREFLAQSRTDMPWLLEIVSRLAMWLASEHGRATGYKQAIEDTVDRGRL